jgi:hypothetical protein
MTWRIWLCGGWLASEGGSCARGGAAASEKYSFGGRREYDCARLAPLAALMVPVGFWKNILFFKTPERTFHAHVRALRGFRLYVVTKLNRSS